MISTGAHGCCAQHCSEFESCSFRTRIWGQNKVACAQVLNAGSGPLAPGQIECVRSVPVVASDGLARFYLQLFVPGL